MINKIGSTRGIPQIKEGKDETKVSLYGDGREGEGNKIVQSMTYYAPFRAGIGANREKVNFSPKIHIAYPLDQAVNLTTIGACYGKKIPDEYNGYTMMGTVN